MKVTVECIPESQVVLEIEVEPERLERSLERAYRRLAQKTEVPGFRKGKAPRQMLERYLGRDAVMQEALGLLIPEVYNQVIEEENIDAIDRPSIEVVQQEPLILKATVPVRPSVDLGNYREVRVEREPVRVSEEQVNEELEELRHRYAILEPVDRSLQTGDQVRADVRVSVDGRSVFSEDDAEFRLRQGVPVLLPGFAEQLPGSEKGVERQFSIDVPQDYPQRPLAGKTCLCRVLVKEIKEERLPELDDAFAAVVGEGFSGLEALRQRLESDLRQSAERETDARYRERVVDGVVAGASVEFPPALAEREMEQLLRERLSASGAGDIERYLRQVRKSEEELRQELRLQSLVRACEPRCPSTRLPRRPKKPLRTAPEAHLSGSRSGVPSHCRMSRWIRPARPRPSRSRTRSSRAPPSSIRSTRRTGRRGRASTTRYSTGPLRPGARPVSPPRHHGGTGSPTRA
ncbi:MAG: trigger factor [Dehalococcoidia bacterium]